MEKNYISRFTIVGVAVGVAIVFLGSLVFNDFLYLYLLTFLNHPLARIVGILPFPETIFILILSAITWGIIGAVSGFIQKKFNNIVLTSGSVIFLIYLIYNLSILQ